MEIIISGGKNQRRPATISFPVRNLGFRARRNGGWNRCVLRRSRIVRAGFFSSEELDEAQNAAVLDERRSDSWIGEGVAATTGALDGEGDWLEQISKAANNELGTRVNVYLYFEVVTRSFMPDHELLKVFKRNSECLADYAKLFLLSPAIRSRFDSFNSLRFLVVSCFSSV